MRFTCKGHSFSLQQPLHTGREGRPPRDDRLVGEGKEDEGTLVLGSLDEVFEEKIAAGRAGWGVGGGYVGGWGCGGGGGVQLKNKRKTLSLRPVTRMRASKRQQAPPHTSAAAAGLPPHPTRPALHQGCLPAPAPSEPPGAFHAQQAYWWDPLDPHWQLWWWHWPGWPSKGIRGTRLRAGALRVGGG
jgi:hypothetical protein